MRFAQILSDLAREMDFDCHWPTTRPTAGLRNAQPAQRHRAGREPARLLGHAPDQLKRNPATRHIPVHVVSVADYSQRGPGPGAVGYALKPVKRDELVHALQRLEAKFTGTCGACW